MTTRTMMGFVVMLQLATLGISVVNARRIGVDDVARRKARDAIRAAAENQRELAREIGRSEGRKR
ncbi:hypothetical protein [Halorientalis halophila]|uniref:hypothetical protein n=1 Tax=Halorientalis halophila TaxID=3108499 RepID=UPI0030091790